MIDNFHFSFRDICKHYRRKSILSDVSITISNSDCYIITGENGAGKTTLLRILAGVEKPDSASIRINDGPATTWRSSRSHLSQSLMYLHQHPYMLTGSLRRNLEYTAKLNPAIIDKGAAVEQVLQWARLEALETQQAVSLSGGPATTRSTGTRAASKPSNPVARRTHRQPRQRWPGPHPANVKGFPGKWHGGGYFDPRSEFFRQPEWPCPAP